MFQIWAQRTSVHRTLSLQATQESGAHIDLLTWARAYLPGKAWAYAACGTLTPHHVRYHLNHKGANLPQETATCAQAIPE